MNRKLKNFFRASALILVFILVSVSLWLWRSAAPRKPDSIPPGDYSYTIAYADYRIQQVMKQKHLPGFAVVLIDDQDTIWQETFGLANLGESNPRNWIQFTDFGLLPKLLPPSKRCDWSKMGWLIWIPLSQNISPILPSKAAFYDSEPITIRSILTHRSGLPRNGCHWVDFNPTFWLTWWDRW